MKKNHFFITATDTEVGKTIFCQNFIEQFLKQNPAKQNITYIKPYQTGVCQKGTIEPHSYHPQSDCESILRTSIHASDVHEISCYSLAAAPYYASLANAKTFKNPIDENIYQKHLTKIKSILNQNSFALVEGSGGILVPISKERMIVDLIKDLQIPTILIAKEGLGTLNHTLLTVRVLTENQIAIKSIFLNEFFADKNPQINRYNHEFLAEKTNIPIFNFVDLKKFISEEVQLV